MVSTALTVFVVSGLVLGIWLVITAQERRLGRRFFAVRFRAWLDRVCIAIGSRVSRRVGHFMKYFVQLSWYYSIHSLLRALLRGLIAIYTFFENMFERNRVRAKELRREKRELSELNHLRQMAEHKEETALSPAEKRKLKKKVLEGKE